MINHPNKVRGGRKIFFSGVMLYRVRLVTLLAGVGIKLNIGKTKVGMQIGLYPNYLEMRSF